MWKTNTAPQTRHTPSHSLMCEGREEREGDGGEELYRGLREMSNYNAVPFNMARLTLERGPAAANVQMVDTICYCVDAVARRIDNRSDDESEQKKKKCRTSCSPLWLGRFISPDGRSVWLKKH